MTETISRRRDSLFLMFTLLGSFLCLAIAIGLAIWSFQMQSDSRTSQALLSAWVAAVFGMLGLLGIPGVYWAWEGRYRTASPASKPKARWAIAAIFIPLGICLGSSAALASAPALFLGSLGYGLAMASVVLAIVLLLRWMGPPLSPRRAWGHFLTGLWSMPALAIFMEGLIFIPSLVFLGLGLLQSPDGRALLDLALSDVNADPQFLYESVRTIAMKPWVVGLTLFVLAVLVPVLEEVIKMTAVLPLMRRNITPAQAFLGGALAGAGFSLLEALLVAEPGQPVLIILIGRTGTTLMHIFTAAITNWALVHSVQDGRWRRLALSFAGAVGVHGIWNASSVGIGLAGLVLETEQAGASAGFATLVVCAGFLVLIALSCMALVALPWISRRVWQAESVEA